MATDAAGAPGLSATEPVGTVAQVDLQSGANGGLPPSRALESALRHVQQTVRADDRVCPFGISRIAIAFGPDAEAVTTRSLGERLARAVTFGLASEPNENQARSAQEGNGRRHDGQSSRPNGVRAHEPGRTTAVVTVDRLVRGGSSPSRLPDGPTGPRGISRGVVGAAQLRHRTVVRYPMERKASGGHHDDARSPQPRAGSTGSLLVIDLTPSTPGAPGLAAQAATATSERIGFCAEAAAPGGDGALDLSFDTAEIDLVVLVVGSEPAGSLPRWSQSSWCLPAQLAAGYASLGVEVLAVSAGAGAGAMTACFEQGATILFDLDQLPAELHAWRRRRSSSRHRAPTPGPIPSRFESLLQLTTSERRVLFYLTTGRSAQEIADNLVVSLTTVRSHIRSILRKLGVRSQLAAVVCANSRDLGRIQPFTPSLDRGITPTGLARRRTG